MSVQYFHVEYSQERIGAVSNVMLQFLADYNTSINGEW